MNEPDTVACPPEMAGDVRAFDPAELHQDVQKWVDQRDFGHARAQ